MAKIKELENTPIALWTNFNGGKDVTNEVLAAVRNNQT